MATNYNPSIASSGLVLCLDAGNTKSYPGSGTTWTDLSGNGATGTLISSPTYSSSGGGSLVFSGTNYVTASTANSLFNFGTGDFSMFLWFKSSYKSNYLTIASLDNTSSGNGIVFYGVPTSGYFRSYVAGLSIDGTVNICTGNWTNLGVTRSSGLVTQYIDGLSRSTFTRATSLLTNQTLAIGSNISTGPGTYGGFPGSISNVNMYNRALSAAEISQNFNALRGRFGL